MKYDGVELILDNFRSVLGMYSVDVQDVVRSAILDGIDISSYIKECYNNPYRLEQIRLGKKEKIDEVFFTIKSGECISRIRELYHSGKTSEICKIKDKLEDSYTEDSLKKLIDWVLSGYNIDKLNISIIPKNLYDVFEQGLQKGFDMSLFNDGKNYSINYIRSCLVIVSNGKDIKPFVKCKKLWNEDCLKQLALFSKIKNVNKWNNLIKYIDSGISSEKLALLITCVKDGISISKLSKEVWSAKAVNYIINAFEYGLNYQELIDIGPDEEVVFSKLNALRLTQSKRVSGRVTKR